MIITRQEVVPDYRAEENGIVLEVTQEMDSMDPREWDNLGTMICWHNRYNLGDKQIRGQGEFDEILLDILEESGEFKFSYCRDNVREFADTDLLLNAVRKYTKAVLLPLYLYDHSGLSMSTTTSSFRVMDSVGWDWGTVGVIYASEKALMKEYGVQEVTDEIRKKAEDCLRSEVHIYDLYLRGEVYSYRLYNKETDEEIDSSGGLFGGTIKELDLEEYLPEEYRHLVSKLEPCKY